MNSLKINADDRRLEVGDVSTIEYVLGGITVKQTMEVINISDEYYKERSGIVSKLMSQTIILQSIDDE